MYKIVREKLYEGAWGSYPLDNDSASDWKWVFGDMIMKELKDKVNKNLKGSSNDDQGYLYYAIGMWEFFKERLDTNYSFWGEDEIREMDELMYKAAKKLLEDPRYIDAYNDPDVVKSYLENYINKIKETYKHNEKPIN